MRAMIEGATASWPGGVRGILHDRKTGAVTSTPYVDKFESVGLLSTTFYGRQKGGRKSPPSSPR
jgi:hypothetical protein